MIEVQLQHETEEGELVAVTVEAFVTADRDGYGTGDSPTLYEVDIRRCLDDMGNPVELSRFEDEQASKLIMEEYFS